MSRLILIVLGFMTLTCTASESGLHDFDFLVGDWQVHHRTLKPGTDNEWNEMDGTMSLRQMAGTAVNVEEHIFKRPTGTTYGIGMRAYDEATQSWAIWWIDSRVPHRPMDPPTVGRFENGVGRFYADAEQDGKPVRWRYVWSHITKTSARWEQAQSFDGGTTWKPNWIMEFTRAPKSQTR